LSPRSKDRDKPAAKRKRPRKTIFHLEFREDVRYWLETGRKIALRALDIIEVIVRDPFNAIGKLEPLKYLVAGTWPRRLIQEHRIVYLVSEDRIDLLQARYHY
jgi:toxin YoeB